MNKAIRNALVVAALMLAASSARGQTADSQAYLQWMLAITDDTLTPRMAAHLQVAGLRDHEQDQVAAILTKFKAEEFGLEESYNNLPSTLAGFNDGTAAFYAKQAALVRSTIDHLKIALPAASFIGLDNRVQHESKNIHIENMAHNQSRLLMPASFHPAPQGNSMITNYTEYSTVAASMATVPLTASMLSVYSGSFGEFNAAQAVDGNTNTIGWDTNSSTSGAGIQIDFGSGNPQGLSGLSFFMSASNSNAAWEVWYGDGNSWMQATTQDFTPILAGTNVASWPNVGSHRFWQLFLHNTPGVGPTINELQLFLPGATVYTTSQVTGTTSCPTGCPHGALHQGWAQVNGNNVYGPSNPPTTYINVSNSASQFLPGDGTPGTATTGGGVQCTVAGAIWGALFEKVQLEFSNTTSQVLWNTKGTNSDGVNFYDAQPDCPTTPTGQLADKPPDFYGPDVVFQGVDPIQTGYLRSSDWCWRWAPIGANFTGIGWDCFNSPRAHGYLSYDLVISVPAPPTYPVDGNTGRVGCTLRDNGYNPSF